MNKTISYQMLQKKYGGRYVLLSRDEKKVLASGISVQSAVDQLNKIGKKLADTVMAGFISRNKTVSVY